MPELPEVETTRRGLAPHCVGRRVSALVVREARLRWPVAETLAQTLRGQRLHALDRRAKYLLFRFEAGTLLWHLGMSGSLRVLREPAVPRKHDHVDLSFDGDVTLRYHDPRRFGSVQWFHGTQRPGPLTHLGPEPLDAAFDGDYLYRSSRGRRVAVKAFLMDAAVVVGVGNIYATEALFLAGIRPDRAAHYRYIPGWNYITGLYGRRRSAGLLRPAAARLRSCGRSLRPLRAHAARQGHWPARQRLLRSLPALMCIHFRNAQLALQQA